MKLYAASINNYVFSTLNSLVVISSGIIMVPIYFKYMLPSTYGAWLASGNVVAMIGILESGLSFVITQKLAAAQAKNDEKLFSELSGSNIICAIILGVALCLVGLGVSFFIGGLVNAEHSIMDEIRLAFRISVVATSIEISASLLGVWPQVWQETRLVGWLSLLANIAGLLAMIIFLLSGFGVVSLALGYLVRAVCRCLYLALFVVSRWRRRNLKSPTFRIGAFAVLIRELRHPFLSKLSATAVGNSQNLVVSTALGPSAVAVYDITAKLATVTFGFANTMHGSLFGLMALSASETEESRSGGVVKEVFYIFVVLVGSISMASVMFSESLVRTWVGIDFFGGNRLVILVVVSLIMTQLKQFLTTIMLSFGLIKRASLLEIIHSAGYAVCLVPLTKFLGIYSVPTAVICAGILFCIVVVANSRNKNKLLKAIDPTMLFKFLLAISLVLFIHFNVNVRVENLWELLVYSTEMMVLFVLVNSVMFVREIMLFRTKSRG